MAWSRTAYRLVVADRDHRHRHGERPPPRSTRARPLSVRPELDGETATFDVAYDGFSPEARAAFQRAVDIWATQLTSPVTIQVRATWKLLGPGVLGSAGPVYTRACVGPRLPG